MMGAAVDVCLAETAFDPTAQCQDTDELCRTAAIDCVNAMIRELEKHEAEQNRVRRVQKKRQQRVLLREMAAACASDVRSEICWDFVKFGRCKRGASCRFVHDVDATVAEIPVAMRLFTADDTFPEEREGHAEKTAVNDAIVHAAASLENKRCLVLDGANCMSTRALRACTQARRAKGDVVVPNSCTETYLTIRALNECLAFHGSLRAFIECNARAAPSEAAVGSATCSPEASALAGTGADTANMPPGGGARPSSGHDVSDSTFWRPATRIVFGVAYLDYCSSLYAGRGTDVEKSPLDDIAALFARGVLDPAGALLVITLAIADDGPPRAEVLSDLTEHVTQHAARVNVVVEFAKRFEFGSTVVQFVSSHATSPPI
jgi:hypothetical protein